MQRRDGFTLIEVVIASTLMIVVLGFSYQLYQRAFKQTVEEELSVVVSGAVTDFELRLKKDIAQANSRMVDADQTGIVITQVSGRIVQYSTECVPRPSSVSGLAVKLDQMVAALQSTCMTTIPCKDSTQPDAQYPVIRREIVSGGSGVQDFPVLTAISQSKPEQIVAAAICFGTIALGGGGATEVGINLGFFAGSQKIPRVTQIGRAFVSEIELMTGRLKFN